MRCANKALFTSDFNLVPYVELFSGAVNLRFERTR
jgi:hypothetical protein